jgi:choline dehydrogenase
LRYWLTHTGPGTSNVAEAGGFVRSALATSDRPDVQLHFVPAQLDDHGRNRLPGHGFTIHACALRPASRGRIVLRSARVDDRPVIQANYLSAPGDLELMIEAARISLAIINTQPFDGWRGDPVFPAGGLSDRSSLERFIRAKAETIYHPVGTCRMGRDERAVVDDRLRVRGTQGLRVVDASVMPTLVSGNTNAPTIMIAEKASDLILAA